jgi:hypothetical protein
MRREHGTKLRTVNDDQISILIFFTMKIGWHMQFDNALRCPVSENTNCSISRLARFHLEIQFRPLGASHSENVLSHAQGEL